MNSVKNSHNSCIYFISCC